MHCYDRQVSVYGAESVRDVSLATAAVKTSLVALTARIGQPCSNGWLAVSERSRPLIIESDSGLLLA